MLLYHPGRMHDALRHTGPLILAVLVPALALIASSIAIAAVPAEPVTVPASPASAPESFSVRMRLLATPVPLPGVLAQRWPVQPGGASPAAMARLKKYHDILVDKLRAVPGLVLVTDSTPGVPGVSYEIVMGLAADWQGVNIEATSVTMPPGYRVGWKTMESPDSFLMTVTGITALFDESRPPEDPEREMAGYIERLRLEVFPKDRDFLDQKMAQFRDPARDVTTRRYALFQLMSVGRAAALRGNGRIPTTYHPDPDLVAAAAEVAATAEDPQLRLNIWSTLASLQIPRVDPVIFVAPAERALARESDLRVQLALVSILADGLRDPRARAALDAVANSEADSDRPELVRMAARQMLSARDLWNEYLVASLKDPQVSDAARLELIRYTSSLTGTTSQLLGRSPVTLDDAALRALASLMKQQGSPELARAAAGLLRQSSSDFAGAEFAELLRSGTGQPLADNQLRRSTISALAYDLRSHPELRALYEDISERDIDPAIRTAARRALDQTK